MTHSPHLTPGSDRFPDSGPATRVPLRGRLAVASYLRAHLYGASVGRPILDRCISAVEPGDRPRLVPLRGQFDAEIATARRLLSTVSLVGAPGRRTVRASATVALAALPAGPVIREPMTRLGLLETLRTLVVAKRSMWELLAESWVAAGDLEPDGGDRGSRGSDDDTVDPGDTRSLLLGLADQARSQEELLEELRRRYGLAVFG